MARIHLTMQGKGGVGKSFIATIMAQYQCHQGRQPLCIDTDPVNDTLYGFKALPVQRLDILDGDEINSRHFDTLIEFISAATADVIIDNGASSFVPLSHYLISNQVPSLLHELGHTVVIHTVITGGQTLLDTVSGLSQLVHQFPADVLFVVWLNPYWGAIEHDGRRFEQMKVYQDHHQRLTAIITIPTLKNETYGRDITEMLQERLTFAEALACSARTIMTRQRLKIVRDQLFQQLTQSGVF